MKIIQVTGPPSPRLRRAAAAFGVALHATASSSTDHLQPDLAHALEQLASLQPGGVALITGPSGAGKSVLLRALERRPGGAPVVTVREPRGRRCAVDAVGRDADEALRTLARAGLAEAGVLARRPGELSAGQRARLGLAQAMHRAARLGPGAWILADEWASTLDRVTAMGLSVSASRWARSAGVRLVAATAHDDVASWLRPDLLVRVPLGGIAHARTLDDQAGDDRRLPRAPTVPLPRG